MVNATNLTNEPHPYEVSKGAIQQGSGTNIFGTQIWLNLIANGAPVNSVTGAGWAGVGSTLVDSTTGTWYSNTGTTAAPTWTAF